MLLAHCMTNAGVAISTACIVMVVCSFRELGGTAKLVIDVIRMEPASARRVLLFACGNAVVCDTSDEAKRVAFNGPERRKVT